MSLSMLALGLLAGVELILLMGILVTPEWVRRPGGRIIATLAFLLLPVAVLWLGTEQHMERATTTSFCLSCHVMNDYGRSLYADDEGVLAATHFQNRLVPRETACYACHKDYTMFGDLSAKIRGIRHLYVQYAGKAPDELSLYGPYQNRECLHCHEGARRFVESPFHADDLEELRSSQISCLTSGCHDRSHAIQSLDELKTWENPGR